MKNAVPYLIAGLSGSCALVYEIVWMRAFTPVFGLSIYSTTAVLCAFMAGLGAGSVSAPALLRHWNGSFWTLYALLELGIGLTAATIPLTTHAISQIFSAVAGIDQSGLVTSAVRFGLSFAVMIVPTAFMGATLPVLAHACRSFEGEARLSSRRIGLLYGLNTLGGALGCLLVGFVLIYRLGIFGTSLATAGLNLGLAATVFLLFGRLRREAPVRSRQSAAVASTRDVALSSDELGTLNPKLLLVLYGCVGVASFGYELIWFRVLVFYLQSATYSLSIMLTLFLLGAGSGSFIFARFLEPYLDRNPLLGTATVLGFTQMAIAILGASTFHIYSNIAPLWAFLIDVLGADSWWVIVIQKGIIAGLVILPSTFLMGVTFPIIARLYKSHGAGDARTTGQLYGANTLGAIFGTLITGFVLFDQVGVQATLTLYAVLSFGIGITFILTPLRRLRPVRVVTGVLATTLATSLLTTAPRVLIRSFEEHIGRVLFYRESASDVTFVYDKPDGVRGLAFNDGRGTSSTAPVNNYVNRLLAYSTMMIHPDAKNVLVISMGCGNTASAYTSFPIERLDIVDISSGPFEAAKYFSTNRDVLEDPRVHTFVEDGRSYLLRTQRTYDIIELELPTLHTDGVVNLYTREFYEIARSKLNDGGVLSQWIAAWQTTRAPSYMLFNTMLGVFPETTLWADRWAWWGNGFKNGGPTRIDHDRVAALFSEPRVRSDMETVETSVPDALSKLVASSRHLRETVSGQPTITDDRTIVDFLVPRLDSPTAFGGGVAYYTSPVRSIFQSKWRQSGSPQRRATGMFPFHPIQEHRKRAEDSIREVAASFPTAELERALGAMKRWD